MTTYTLCKRVIEGKLRVGGGYVTQEYKDDMMIKLDTFLLNNRITDTEYNELVAMLITKPRTI